MAIRRYDELIAWQLAEQFSQEVHRLVSASSGASRDYRYRDQLFDSASAVHKDIAEGFVRYSARTFMQFLDVGLGSLAEAELSQQRYLRRRRDGDDDVPGSGRS